MRLFPSPLAFSLVTALLFTDATWLCVTPVDLDLRSCSPICYAVGAMIIGLLLLTKLHPSTASVERFRENAVRFVMGMIFILVGWTGLRLFNHLTMTTALPYADASLAKIDHAMHLDWVGYFAFVRGHEVLREVLGQSYTSLTLLSAVAFILAFLIRGAEQAARLLETFFLAAVLCTIIGPFFPAKGAPTFFSEIIGSLEGIPGTYSVVPLETLRIGGSILLNASELPGLVTFPSFHTAAAVVVAAGFWRTKLFVPVAAYSLVVIASTPVFGGHYFIDLIGGALIAFTAIAATRWKATPAGQLYRPSRSTAAVTVTSAAMPPRSAARTQAAPDWSSAEATRT